VEFPPVQQVLQPPVVSDSVAQASPLAAHRELVAAVAKVNASELLGQDDELTFQMDRDIGKPVIRLVDRKTKEVLQQIPPEYVLNVARAIEEHG
jgi:flagellar protein FlaG